jgi:hypothetical protein
MGIHVAPSRRSRLPNRVGGLEADGNDESTLGLPHDPNRQLAGVQETGCPIESEGIARARMHTMDMRIVIMGRSR